MTKYLITLKPVEDYFFGGENTFRTNDDSYEVNYFARSNPYPQQTSLLGLLRYMLLVSNDALPIGNHKKKADALIGKNSFDPKEKENAQRFGVIQSVSPLYIYDTENRKFYRISLETENFEVNFSDNGTVITHSKKEFSPEITEYDAKKHYGIILKDTDDNKLSFDKVFKELKPRIGIDVDRSEDDDKKMYKQVFYTLNKPFVFAFFAGLDKKYSYDNSKGEKVKLKNKHIVFFGGEQKRFVFEAKPDVKEPVFSLINVPQKGKTKFVLLSDALVDSKFMNEVDFMINETQDFRTVKIAFDNKKFNKKNDVSIKFNLLKRGSVIYTGNSQVTRLEDCFEKYNNYTKIGFNKLLKIN